MSAAIDALSAAIASATDNWERVTKDALDAIAAGLEAQAELDRARRDLDEMIEAKAVLEREARVRLAEGSES